MRAATAKDWVVYSKRPFAGPAQVLAYLARYTHRVGISQGRLLAFDAGAGQVRFRVGASRSAAQRPPPILSP